MQSERKQPIIYARPCAICVITTSGLLFLCTTIYIAVLLSGDTHVPHSSRVSTSNGHKFDDHALLEELAAAIATLSDYQKEVLTQLQSINFSLKKLSRKKDLEETEEEEE